jgi:hypothetical protein
MTPKVLVKRLRKRPFTPFRMIVSEGAAYDVRHPEQVIVMRDSVVIGIPAEAEDFYETSDLVNLIHVIRLEPLSSQKSKGKSEK